MTDAKADQVFKDLLWEYTQDRKKVDAIQVELNKLADSFRNLATRLGNPSQATLDEAAIIQDVEKMCAHVEQSKQLGQKIAQAKTALQKQGIV